MRYIVVFSILTLSILSACSSSYQSSYPELRRKLVDTKQQLTPDTPFKRIHTVGIVGDNSTFLFGRLKVIDDKTGNNITHLCQFQGLSNKYYRINAFGPKAALVKDDSLFFSTSPASNIHPTTGLFAVHTDKGHVGLTYAEESNLRDFEGGRVLCRLNRFIVDPQRQIFSGKGSERHKKTITVSMNTASLLQFTKRKSVKIPFKANITNRKTKTYIGDFTVTLFSSGAAQSTIEDAMDKTYNDLVAAIPSADNPNVELKKSVAVTY